MTPLVLMLLALVSFAVGAGFLLGRRTAMRRIRLMETTETFSAQELEGLWRSVTGEIGAGSFSKRLEIKGVVECETPLTAEASKIPCVYYRTRVQREYEVESQTVSSRGRRRQIERRAETMSDVSRRVRFWVRDASGRVQVDPADASVTPESFVSRFEPAAATPASGAISIGALRLELPMGGTVGRGSRTLGYRIEEQGVRVGAQVYVLGEAHDREGSLLVGAPPEGGLQLIISTKPEEQLRRTARRRAVAFLVGAGAAGALGVVLVIAAIAAAVR